jgi:hypothetical protein
MNCKNLEGSGRTLIEGQYLHLFSVNEENRYKPHSKQRVPWPRNESRIS